MIPRPLVLAVALGIALTGCSQGGGESQGAADLRSPDAVKTEAPESAAPTAAPADRGEKGAGAEKEATEGLGTEALQERPPDSSGGVKHPQLGRYEYSLRGTYSFGPDSERAAYPKGLSVTVDYVGRDDDPEETGPQFTARSTFEAAGETSMTITQWEPRRILLLYTDVVSDEENSCMYQPPIEILRMPIKTSKIPTQSWQGSGCSGTIDVDILRRQDVSAAGRRWKTWRIRYRSDYVLGTLRGTRTDTVWFSPELGTDVKIDRRIEGTDDGEHYDVHQVLTLRRYPR